MRPRFKHTAPLLAAAALLLFMPASPVVAQAALDWDAIADRLVTQIDPQPGERVLLVALPGRFDALVPALRRKLGAAGAVDLGAIATQSPQPAGWRTEFTADLRGRSQRELVASLASVDVAVMLPGAQPADPVYAAMQQVLWNGTGRTVHFHWSGTYWPSMETRPEDDAADALLQRALLETDYAALAAIQIQFTAALRRAPVRVTTPAGTDLRFEVRDRPVTRQDGDASAARASTARNLIDREIELPAGAIRVAPIEETVNGTIVFPPSLWNGTIVEDLRLVFENGKVVSMDAASGLELAEAVMERAGESARSFREFVLGFNPLLPIAGDAEPWIPYYGYGAGIVRLSLGDNRELGGDVTGGFVRWNLFLDATVRVGDETWVTAGQLTPPQTTRDRPDPASGSDR